MPMTKEDIENFKAGLIETGEPGVREKLLLGEYGKEKRKWVDQYLDGFDAERAGERRDEELDIGRAANKIARDANRWSMVATAIALVALVVAVLAYFQARP